MSVFCVGDVERPFRNSDLNSSIFSYIYKVLQNGSQSSDHRFVEHNEYDYFNTIFQFRLPLIYKALKIKVAIRFVLIFKVILFPFLMSINLKACFNDEF